MIKYKSLSEAEKRGFLFSFQQALPNMEQQLALDPNQVQRIGFLTQQAMDDIDKVKIQELTLTGLIEKRNESREIFLEEFTRFVNTCRVRPTYSKSVGETAGFEVDQTPKSSFKSSKDASNSKFDIKISTAIQKVSFEFKKQRSLSIIIYGRRGGEVDFSLVKQVSGNEYEDTRSNLNNANAEKREYCFALTKNDQEGARSATYTVAVVQ